MSEENKKSDLMGKVALGAIGILSLLIGIFVGAYFLNRNEAYYKQLQAEYKKQEQQHKLQVDSLVALNNSLKNLVTYFVQKDDSLANKVYTIQKIQYEDSIAYNIRINAVNTYNASAIDSYFANKPTRKGK